MILKNEDRSKILELFEVHKDFYEERVNSGIELYRKGYGKIKVVDKDGNPVKNVKIKINQKSHEFKFGANLFMLDELETAEKNEVYKKSFADVFNMATLPFYWNSTEPERGKTRYDKNSPELYRRPPIDRCIEFCEENGMNQAQGFDHMLQVLELNRAKAMVPNSAKDIETFEMHVKKIMESYLQSVEDYNTARESAREEFASALTSKDKTIASLQEKVAQLKADKEIAETTAANADRIADQAVKEASVAKDQAGTALKLAEEKDKTIATLADKLAVAEGKAEGYDELKKSEEAAKGRIIELQKDVENLEAGFERELKASKEEADRTLKSTQEASDRKVAELKKDHETELRELKTDMERKISDAQKDAALSCANEVAKKEREMNITIREADKENARLQAQIENLQAKIAELTAALNVKTQE